MKTNIKKSSFRINFLFVISMVFLLSCQGEEKNIPDYEIAARWADMTLFITKNTPANSPTFASRCLGYIGLTQYESVVHGYPNHISLAGQLSGLDSLPAPDSTKEYNWLMALNSAQSEIIKSIYRQTSDENKKKIDSLENKLYKTIRRKIKAATAKRSVEFGRMLAKAIFEWSKTDGGHRGYLNNYDPNYKREKFPGSWEPPLFAQSFSHKPLHPYWGNNRTFCPKNKKLPLPKFIPHSTDVEGEYYKQFFEVYEKRMALTMDEKKAAIWWSDDPDVTFSPGGHLYFITAHLIRKNYSDLITSTKAFARVGISVADAFIKCWKWKYHFFSERPNTYVTKHIDEKWESFWPDPPFPAFPSGHAIQASAAATALMSVFENNTPFIDRAHEGRERDEIRNVDFTPREYQTIWQVAEETAQSRFYGGIHTKQDNRVGLEQGKIITQNILDLNWNK